MADANLIWDIQTSFEGGVDAGVSPQRVAANRAYEAENLQFRGGQPHARSTFGDLPLSFVNDADGSKATYYANNIFQGGGEYHTPDNDYLVFVIGGRVYVLEPLATRMEVTDVTPADGGNNPRSSFAWMCQADKYFVIQDGEHVPIVLLDKVSQRAGGVNPIPIGTVMAYGQDRLWVAIKDEFLAGDLVGSEDDAVLKFSEAVYLNEGGSFKPISPLGNVINMAFIAVQDTSTGQGGLLVFYENGVVSVNGLVPRDQWKNTPIQQVVLIGVGATGFRSGCHVNGDYFFQSHDGWRSYRQARAEAQGWSQLPLSSPVKQYVDNEWSGYRKYNSAVYFDNRLIVTTAPTASNGRSYNLGLLSLDFDPINAGLGQATAPAWDGYWTLQSRYPVQLFSGVFGGAKRCFCACLENGKNTLAEIQDGVESPSINWRLTTRRFLFPQKAAPHVKCRLADGGDIRISYVLEDGTLNVGFAQDDASNVKPWATFQVAGQKSVCTTDNACSISYPPESYYPRLILPNGPTTVDSITDRYDDLFYDLQLVLTGTGAMQIEWIRPQATMFSDKEERSSL